MLDLTASTPEQLAAVEGEVHDWFFDLEDVRHDTARRRVAIPFRRWDYDEARELPAPPEPARRWLRRRRPASDVTEWEAPFHRWHLHVDHVLAFEVEGGDEAETASFNTLAFDAGDGTLTIECFFPVVLRMKVGELSVRLQETRELLGTAWYMTSGDPSFATAYTGEVLGAAHAQRQTGSSPRRRL